MELGQDQTELEQYSKEPLLSWKDGGHFDILSWWKAHGTKYPNLSQMARDVLAIPASTLASESAFSVGGRVVNKYHSRLDPQVVEALICTKDWIRASNKDPKDLFSNVDDLAGSGVNATLQKDGGATDAAESIVDGDNIVDLEER